MIKQLKEAFKKQVDDVKLNILQLVMGVIAGGGYVKLIMWVYERYDIIPVGVLAAGTGFLMLRLLNKPDIAKQNASVLIGVSLGVLLASWL
jgi:hypothetical protein